MFKEKISTQLRKTQTQSSFHLWSRDNSNEDSGNSAPETLHLLAQAILSYLHCCFYPKNVIHKTCKTMLICGRKVIIFSKKHLFPLLKCRYGKGSIKRLLRVKTCLSYHNVLFIRGPVPAPHPPVWSSCSIFCPWKATSHDGSNQSHLSKYRGRT